MTTVTVSIVDNDMASTIEGKGVDELQKCVDKMRDGLCWTLLIKSKAISDVTYCECSGDTRTSNVRPDICPVCEKPRH